MHAARDLAAGVQALDRGMRRGRNHLSVVVDHDAAHGVVDLRADFDPVERGLGDVESLVELQNAVEVLVGAFLDEVVEPLDLSKECILLDAEVLGQSFKGIELLHCAHFKRQLHKRGIDGLDDGVVAYGDRVVLIGADDLKESISLDPEFLANKPQLSCFSF